MTQMAQVLRTGPLWGVAATVMIGAGCVSHHASPPLPPPEPGTPKRYECRRVAGPLTIDGVIARDEWAFAPWSDAFVDIEGSKRRQPRLETRMKMAWDDECLYVAAWMQEPHVWATYDRRDMIVFKENDFEIFIDPNGDTRNYFEIEINAIGTIFDLFLPRTYIDRGLPDHDWNCLGMRWAVDVDGTVNDARDVDRGWTVEFALPWSTFADKGGMPCPPGAGDEWRINFSRVQWTLEAVRGTYRKSKGLKEDNWVWTPQGVIDMHRPQRWGYVEFTTESTENKQRDRK